jgi:hypothetical protein
MSQIYEQINDITKLMISKISNVQVNEGEIKMAVEKIKHFISKEAINIDGLGQKVVEKFWDLELIRFPQDIFNLRSQNFSTTFCPRPSMLIASFDIKCLIFSTAILISPSLTCTFEIFEIINFVISLICS